MLGIELGGKVHLNIFAFNDAYELLGGFRMSIDHLLAKLLHDIRLTFLGASLPACTSYMSLMAAFCTKSGVLGAPHPANTVNANAAIIKFRIAASEGMR